MPRVTALIHVVRSFDAAGNRIAVERFGTDRSRELAMAHADRLTESDAAAYAVVLDARDQVVEHFGHAPIDTLRDLPYGRRFAMRGKVYTTRTGGSSGMSYYAGDDREHVLSRGARECLPAWRENGQPCMVTVNALTKIEFLED